MLFDDLKSKIFEIKRNNTKLISNYYYQDLSNRELTVFSNKNGVLFFAYDNEYNVFKTYFLVDNIFTLNNLLIESNWNENSSLEILNKGTNDFFPKELFEKYEFTKFVTLKKMSFLTNSDIFKKFDDPIVYCTRKDIKNLKLMFLNNFNKYCDNLPSTKEIENAITKNLIIKKTDNENIIGFLWFDKKQILTELRYLYVNENYRGLKISNKLMNQYLYLTKYIKKKQLWVLEDNNVAINLYKKFGYEFEELKDTIYKKVKTIYL